MQPNHYVQREIDRVKRKKDRTFIARNIGMKRFLLYFLYPASAIWSAFTEGSAIFSFLSEMLTWGAALFFMILLVALIEAGKFWFGKEVVEDFYDDNVKTFHDYVSLTLKCIGALLCFGASISLSIWGGPDAAKFWKKTTAPIALLSEEPINQRFDEQIEWENEEIKKGEDMTWQGAITDDGGNRINNAKVAKLQIEESRSTELVAAREENTRRRHEYKENADKAGT